MVTGFDAFRIELRTEISAVRRDIARLDAEILNVRNDISRFEQRVLRRFDDVDERLDRHEVRISALEARIAP